ncbi:SMP-30/gluconolactonase/LRE family protein [Hyphomonas sp.]|uniref:SMP-30/gluconolactonase/LRE family protein n=1 Tax=Hyphomonas sp. TaxID=87 RepID=UPI003F6E66EB
MQRLIALAALAAGLGACAPAPVTEPAVKPPAALPVEAPRILTLEDGVIFPADRSLNRPESGVFLADGTLVVADQVHGLVALSADGTSRPFGNLPAAGYIHAPPENAGAPNGVSFEPGKTHLLVADIFTGTLYRVDVAAETAAAIYDHPFGMNYAHRDSTGAIWFSQSTENAAPNAEERMFAAVNVGMGDGALYRIPPAAEGQPPGAPDVKLTGLNFANGFVVDETRGEIFLSETLGGHVLGYKVDVATGTLGDRRIVAEVTSPDNVEQDETGLLWVASPISSELITINPDTGETRVVFHPVNEAGDAAAAEFRRRRDAGEPTIDLLTPDVPGQLPGLMTGVILTPGGGSVYVSSLGDALVKLEKTP